MSLRRARAIAYGVVAVLAVVAIVLMKPLPPEATPPAGEVISQGFAAPQWSEREEQVKRGETLMNTLARGGLSSLIAQEALKAATMLDFRRIPAGMPVRIRSLESDTVPSEIILELAVDRLLHLRRSDSTWTGEEVRLPWTVDTIVVTGRIESNLYTAMDSAAIDVLPRADRVRLRQVVQQVELQA